MNQEKLDQARDLAAGQKNYAQAGRRRKNDTRVIENPLAQYTDEELVADALQFQRRYLPNVDPEKVVKAARVAKDIRTYDEVARSDDLDAGKGLPVQLNLSERRALKRERDVAISERGMYIVILTVSLAAFLQGYVQSSINGASIFRDALKLNATIINVDGKNAAVINKNDWLLGAANGSPFLFAAVLGCPLALPTNDLVGRRGAMVIAAMLILASSVGSAFCRSWYALFLVRIINGLGMGLKAVSTTILASETAVGYWRGTSILAWQLWVAFGIMMGFVFNLIFMQASTTDTTLSLILGAPFVPALFLLVALWFCPESPRYYMRRRGPYYSPQRAYNILLRLRNTELQALRDLYLVQKSLEIEDYASLDTLDDIASLRPQGPWARFLEYLTMYRQLFQERRLRNAVVSTSTVAIAQQLCGINVMAFYSGSRRVIDRTTGNLFQQNGTEPLTAMEYSLGFGAVNFVFGLPAIRTIDTLGRRKWLTLTLPAMCLFMMAAALTFRFGDNKQTGLAAAWLFSYSPGLGPIPFTLASESFPLTHREAGCSFAVAVNLLFAGILSITVPPMITSLNGGGSLGIFSGLNLVALVLVFLFVEETKRRSLEDLDLVFAVPKRTFVRFQVQTYLPWFLRHYFGRLVCCFERNKKNEDGGGIVDIKPNLYIDRIWDPTIGGVDDAGRVGNSITSPFASPPAADASSPAYSGHPFISVRPEVGGAQAQPDEEERGGPVYQNATQIDNSDAASSIHD